MDRSILEYIHLSVGKNMNKYHTMEDISITHKSPEKNT